MSIDRGAMQRVLTDMERRMAAASAAGGLTMEALLDGRAVAQPRMWIDVFTQMMIPRCVGLLPPAELPLPTVAERADG